MIRPSDLYKSKYYVYEHWIDGKVFYVGKGTGARAVDFKSRNKKWLKHVNERFIEIKVNIVKHFDNDLEAIEYEKIHIKKLLNLDAKLTNVVYNLKMNGSNRRNGSNRGLEKPDLNVISKYLNKHLKVRDKTNLCVELNIKNKNGNIKRWRAIKSLLQKSEYDVKEKRVTVDGKRIYVSVITVKKGDY